MPSAERERKCTCDHDGDPTAALLLLDRPEAAKHKHSIFSLGTTCTAYIHSSCRVYCCLEVKHRPRCQFSNPHKDSVRPTWINFHYGLYCSYQQTLAFIGRIYSCDWLGSLFYIKRLFCEEINYFY
jgi:hypothetical protein